MNFSETLPFVFTQVSTYLKVELEKQLSEFGLHSGQIFILFELWNAEGVSQIELAGKLKLSPPTINKMIKSLAKTGFVICNNCPQDGRVVRVYLTPKGVAIRPKVEEKWLCIEEKLAASFTVTEKLVLDQLFRKIGENLSN